MRSIRSWDIFLRFLEGGRNYGTVYKATNGSAWWELLGVLSAWVGQLGYWIFEFDIAPVSSHVIHGKSESVYTRLRACSRLAQAFSYSSLG